MQEKIYNKIEKILMRNLNQYKVFISYYFSFPSSLDLNLEF